MDSLKPLLEQVYTPDQVQYVLAQLQPVPTTSSPPPTPTAEWYKNLQIYSVYPDSFCSDSICSLYQLTKMLDHIKSLGCNGLHILPPYESPGIDGGFDVSDYLQIKDTLGGNTAFDHLLAEAQTRQLSIFIDLILNHVSDQHEWFQKAINGDTFFRDFFVYSAETPHFIKTIEKSDGLYARYLIGEKEQDIYIVFPEQAQSIPHWTQQTDGYWYYHTFYPQQIDLNWDNPSVFIELSKIILYWAKRGMSFRLDAIPYVGKRWAEAMADSSPRAYAIVQALRTLVSQHHVASVFLAETNRSFEELKQYFGTKQHRGTDLAYNFQLTEAIWIALIQHDYNFLWQTLEKTKQLPDWSQMVTFLRNHDALTFRYCPNDAQIQICSMLQPHGLKFGESHAVAGRTASFLEHDPKRIILAHFLLASLPGAPAVYYGDEIGQSNNFEYMLKQSELKNTETDLHLKNDTRDINRGPIQLSEFAHKENQKIYQMLGKIFSLRAQFPIATTFPYQSDPGSNTILAIRYSFAHNELAVYINTTTEDATIALTEDFKEIISINGASYTSNNLSLPATSGIWLVTG
jgi:maltose alpha-D-glucosyltransferase/alpha-amylase